MKIYCSGIGGIGLSAYAALRHAEGHTVLGSDRAGSALIEDLRSQGINVTHTQDGSAIPSDAGLFVYSEAIPEDAPERKRAAEMGIKQQSYPEALGELSRSAEVIAVCGTHGKSSTTALAARMLIAAGKDPTIVVGTKMRELGGRNWRKGKSEMFLLEACEYRRSFLQYNPKIILLTTCDGDHFDYFASIDDYRNAFVEFIRKLPNDGVVITHQGDPDCSAVTLLGGRRVVDADTFPELSLKTPGAHMRENAKLVLALADLLSIPADVAQKSLEGFEGTWRRLENRGTIRDGVTIYDDYGHHPREIRATIEAIREAHPKRRLVCVFQPHTHDRTLKLYDDFTRAFRGVDLLVLPNIYDARSDIETAVVDVERFLKDIAKKSGCETLNGNSLAETEKMLRTSILKKGDLLLTLGAGDITNLATAMLKK